MDVPALRRRLLAWYGRNQRALPWRGPRVDVYGTWVSEAMLQQTRVDVVVPYYQRWMTRFPTVQELAKAPEEAVLQAWAGLGYYSRARNLHAAARQIAAKGSPGWPTTLQLWRALPGVGAYTAAAIASIAQGRPHACVDGNVVRVVARLTNDAGDVANKSVRTRIEATAQEWLAPRRPGDWNQAMMELGATVCLPRNPQCDTCPVASLCAAKAAGTQQQLPRKAKTIKPRDEQRHLAVVEHDGRILFVRQPAGLLGGLWSLPGGSPDKSLIQHVLDQTGLHVRPKRPVRAAKHQFSHRTWHMQVQRADLAPHQPPQPHQSHQPGSPHLQSDAGGLESQWIPIDALHHHAIPTAAKVALAAVGIPGMPAQPVRTIRAVAKTKPKTRRASAPP